MAEEPGSRNLSQYLNSTLSLLFSLQQTHFAGIPEMMEARESDTILFKCWKKRTYNPESYTRENLIQKWRGNQDILRQKKKLENLWPGNLPSKNGKGSSPESERKG